MDTKFETTVFRPHPLGHVMWWVVAPALWCALYFVFRILGAFETVGAGLLIYLLGLGVLLSGIYVSTSYCKISDQFIESGFFFGAKIQWSEIEKWTRWGADGTLFIQSKSGKIISSGTWAFYGDRTDKLEQLLVNKVGPQTTGENGVLPKILKFFIGSLIR